MSISETTHPAGADGAPGRPEPGPKTRRAARGALAFAVAELLGKVATLAFMVAAARTLGPGPFGAFAYALSFSLLAATLPAWGFDALLVQRASSEPRRLPILLSETLVWRTAIAVPVFLAAGLAGVALNPGGRSVGALLLILGATLLDVYNDAGRAAVNALQRQSLAARNLLVQRVATAGLALAALFSGTGLVGMCVGYMAGTLVAVASMALTIRSLGIRVDLRSVNREGLARTGRLSIALGIDTMVALALARIDQVLLAAMKGDAAVGVYAAAYRLFETVLFLSWAVTRSIFPVMSAGTEGWRVRRGVEQGMAVVGLVYVPFAVAMLLEAERIVELLFGSAYAAAAAPAARWLAVAPLLFAVGFLGSYALVAKQRRWQVVTASIVALVVNVGLNLLLIPPLAGTGSAIATTAAYGLEAVITVAFLVPVIGWPRLHRGLVLPAIAASSMALVLLAVRAPILAEAALAGAVYGSVWLLLARWFGREQVAVAREVIRWRR